MQLAKVISLALLSLSMICLVGLLWMHLHLMEQYLIQQKWQGCAQAYRIEYADEANHAVVLSPNKLEMEKCIGGL